MVYVLCNIFYLEVSTFLKRRISRLLGIPL